MTNDEKIAIMVEWLGKEIDLSGFDESKIRTGLRKGLWAVRDAEEELNN